MIYFYTWNSSFLVAEQVKAWKNKFVSKFWDFNMLHIKDLNTVDNNFLIENTLSTSFLSEKKLIIINLDKETNEEKTTTLIHILNKVPDDNIVLFNSTQIDKRSKLFKELKKSSEFKEFNIKNDFDVEWIISKKYGGKISPEAVKTIIKYKSGDLNKIESELNKLLINFDYINNKEITDNIIPELEESIFQVVDDILNKNITQAIEKINIILNDTNIYWLYNNLLANLRTSIYILKLKNIKKSNISEILSLWNRWFLVNKNYRITYKEAQKLYINLVNIDKKMKSWKLNWTSPSDMLFELERILIS